MTKRKIKKKPKEFHPQAIRHAKDVDFRKASPNCKRCNGSGVIDAIQPDESMRKGGVTEPVPIVCRCVTLNGGVAVHPLMKVMSNLREELKSGQWAKKQLTDLRIMSPGNKKRALAQLRQMMENEESDPVFKEEARKVLKTIENEGVDEC